MGAQWITANPNFDPDRAYELTTDNVKKIMAIHMRFRYVLYVTGFFNCKREYYFVSAYNACFY